MLFTRYARTTAISTSFAGKRRPPMGLGIWCRSGNCHATADTRFAPRSPLCRAVAIGTGEFFESEDDVLQGFDVRDLVQRWDLQLIEQPLHRVRVEPLGNSFQTVKSAGCGLQHLKDLPFDGCVAD